MKGVSSCGGFVFLVWGWGSHSFIIVSNFIEYFCFNDSGWSTVNLLLVL